MTTTTRKRELQSRRDARNIAQTDNAAGYRAAQNGEPVPADASPAFITGHKDGSADRMKAAADAAPFHYFASTALAWAVGATRREAIAKVARASGADAIKRNVKANGGLYAWTCRVDAHIGAEYDIENYAPRGVPTSHVATFAIQNAAGAVLVED